MAFRSRMVGLVFRLVPQSLRRMVFFGNRHACPVCEASVVAFLPYRRRVSARCPICGCLERHRLTWLVLRERTNLFDGRTKRVLHIAPERGLEERFRTLPYVEYVSADLEDKRAMLRFDVTNIPLADGSFDVVVCSHVLEHVLDDRAAMRELARVVNTSGWAVIEVPPLHAFETYEDATVTSPHDREQVFGQRDHVRLVGHDYPQRLAENGWTVQRVSARDFPSEEIRRFGLHREEEIFLCRPKP